jgi:hypothetical protein
MQLIPTGSNYAAQVKALVQQRQCLPLGELVGFLVADEDFYLARKQTADGGRTLGGEE